jgi:hypothetical protein
MARAGDELVNPVTGLQTVFRKTAQETGGELLRVDWIGSPGWNSGPDHVHPTRKSVSSSSPASWVYGWEASSASTVLAR